MAIEFIVFSKEITKKSGIKLIKSYFYFDIMKVVLGGTFDIIHKGHKKLIDKAFETASENGSVFIGVSTGDLLNCKKKR